MLEAFKKLGYQVDVVSGYSRERKVAIKHVRDNIRSGIKYDFCYSECSTMPTALTDTDHFPRAPFLDALFFRHLNRNDIKIGVFYRDIYWCFESKSLKNLFNIKSLVAKAFYLYDLMVYKKYIDCIFTPSIESRDYIPIVSDKKFYELPPGVEKKHNLLDLRSNNKLNLLYVGSIKKEYYNLEALFLALSGLDFVNLTMCIREEELCQLNDEYDLSNVDINVVHSSGIDLEALYRWADLSMIFFEPIAYRKLAVPVKLFESLGFSVPVISSLNTWVGSFVEKNSVGWAIKYNEKDLQDLLLSIHNDKEILPKAKQNVQRIASASTWDDRCKFVSEVLL